MAPPAPAAPVPAPPAGAPAKGKPVFTFATLIPLVIIHVFSFISFVIYLAGLAATDRQLRNTDVSSTTRQNIMAFPWFLLVAYAFVMAQHAVVMVVPQLHSLKLLVALLLAITVSWFGKSIDDIMSQTRGIADLDQDIPHVSDLLSSLRCLDAGGVMCVLAMLAALIQIAANYSLANSAHAANSAPNAAHQSAEAEVLPLPPGMRKTVCPKCGSTTVYPSEYEAVCCVSCQTVIQVGGAAV